MDDVTNMLTIWVFFCYQGMWTLYTFFLEKSIIWVTNEFVSGQIDNKKMLMSLKLRLNWNAPRHIDIFRSTTQNPAPASC